MNAINVPKDGLAGLQENLRADLLSGFLVFLIALPLCIGISIASGFGPVGGLFTAIIGGLIVGPFQGCRVSIKGPAAGLIPIAIGCVEAFRGNPETAQIAYQCALAVVVITGLIQIVFGLIRAGVMSDFFPNAPVHGMLASIGILIISTQVQSVFGHVPTKGASAIQRLTEIPGNIAHLNPAITLIGLLSLAILFIMPRIKHPLARKIPGPMLVLMVAIPLGLLFGVTTDHSYQFAGNTYEIVAKTHAVQLGGSMVDLITFPNFGFLTHPISIQFIVLFALVGSIESTASAKAIDTLDPFKRKTDFNRDLLAIGVGNAAAGMIGGLPMISEIVRSSANINNGAKTRWSNVWHGLFLLIVLAAIPWAIAYIPKAALGAMLVFTGLRLASWKEFRHMAHVGKEQLAVFLITIAVTIGKDLLWGIIAGVVAEIIVNLIHRAPASALFKSAVVAHDDAPDTVRLEVTKAATFTNYISLKRRIFAVDPSKHVVVDLSKATFVDANVMEYFQEITEDFARANRKFVVTGLERHAALSHHANAARKLAA